MQYGYFDDEKKEYVITNPQTPASWSNYLGSTRYGAIITNNAGGYSFFQSAVRGRFMRFRSNTIPMDQPGRYLYIRDQHSHDFWSASWQPIGKPSGEYKSVCRHGTAYTTIESKYAGILSETRYFVPLGKDYEYWHCKITNTSGQKRTLRLFTYVEYATHFNMHQDIVNLQYTQYILRMREENGIIEQGVNVNLPPDPHDLVNEETSNYSFLGIAGVPVTGYDTDREKFLGLYGDYSRPEAVVKGACSQSIAVGNNGCGSLQIDLELEPGESREFVVVMGIGLINPTGKEAVEEVKDLSLVDRRFNELVEYWHSKLRQFTVNTPSAAFNSMINVWNPYNCLITFAWSRAASLVYAGERDGYGYRDTVQDLVSIPHIIPEEVRQRLELMITGQVSTGGAMPVVSFLNHMPGKMQLPDEKEYRSDDCMWLFNAIPSYVKETGDMDFYMKVLPYADKGEDTVLGHMKRAMEFNLERSGVHGLPCGLLADWNDCLELGHGGETVFVALQLYYAFGVYAEVCERFTMTGEVEWAKKQRQILGENIEKYAWDGDWYKRAFSEEGRVFGSKSCEEGSLWLNPQTWGVISGHATGDRVGQILEVVNQRLATEYGIMICDPPYKKEKLAVIRAVLFNESMKENGSVFNHTQGWVVMAEAMNGNGNRAFAYYKSFMPASQNEQAGIRKIEPYVYSQSTHGRLSPRHGTSSLPWLTGAATWAYHSAVQYIIGIRPEYDGITIDPCVPSDWKAFSVVRVFRKKTLNISIVNEEGRQKGVRLLEVNGETIQGGFIPIGKLKETNTVKAYM